MMDPPKPRVLLVDDELELLAGLVRSLRSEHYEISTASTGSLAIDMLRTNGPFAVIVSDLRMPSMDGVELLSKAREVAPDTVRLLFTGQLDLQNAIAALNEGAIFRCILKPCPRTRLAMTLKAAVRQHQMLTAERVLLEQTLHGSVKALMDILALSSPVAFGRAARLREAVGAIARALGISEIWHAEVAAMLSQVGSATLPYPTLEKVYQGRALSEAEEAMMRRVPAIAEQVVDDIPRLEPVREILCCQRKHFDGTGAPPGPGGDAIPWGGRALKIALDLDALESQGVETSLAFDTLRGRQGWYDPAMLEALAGIRRGERHSDVRELPAASLRAGMVFAQDVRSGNGVLFIARGQEVTVSLLERLHNFAPGFLAEQPIRVMVPGNHPVSAIVPQPPDAPLRNGIRC
jgi:response regulator RpfG family c-di-GMP phosphodiesterase